MIAAMLPGGVMHTSVLADVHSCASADCPASRAIEILQPAGGSRQERVRLRFFLVGPPEAQPPHLLQVGRAACLGSLNHSRACSSHCWRFRPPAPTRWSLAG